MASNEPAPTVVADEPLVGSYFVSAYPPFSRWSAEAALAYRARLDAGPEPDNPPLGLYVHVPFCVRRCEYCYYLAYAGETHERVDDYIDAVLSEAQQYADTALIADRPLSFVYVGGGTPSLLSAGSIERLMGGLRQRFCWDAVEEVSFECAPQTVTEQKLQAMLGAGVTRVSLGAQQLDDRVLELSGRVHLVDQIERAYEEMRQAGFDIVNLDLMVGMVGESAGSFERSLERVIALAPESVTIYQLEIPLNTPLYRALEEGRVEGLASWRTKRQRLAAAFERLEDAGYSVRSAYAAVRDPGRHRFRYQDAQYHGADLLGLGVSAFSYLGGVHHQNRAALGAYTKATDSGRLPLGRACVLSEQERLVREFVLQLKLGRADRSYFEAKFGIDLAERFAEPCLEYERGGWLQVDDREVHLTRSGLLRADRLLPAFYLPEHRGVRYS